MARRQLQLAWPPLTTNLKVTMGALFALWVVQIQLTGPDGTFTRLYLGLSAHNIMEGRVWTILSHAFFHGGFMHLLFNGFALWLFGGEVDRRWSLARFWRFTLLCALGGGLAVLATQFSAWGVYSWLGYGQLAIQRMLVTPTIGFSGAIMGLVAAYCWQHWDRQMYFFFFRVTGKTLLPLFVGLDVLMIAAGQPISISGHLGGMLTGLLLVSGYWRPRKLKLAVRRWKRWGTSNNHSRTPDRRNDGRYFN
jgi:rhomboid-like protein